MNIRTMRDRRLSLIKNGEKQMKKWLMGILMLTCVPLTGITLAQVVELDFGGIPYVGSDGRLHTESTNLHYNKATDLLTVNDVQVDDDLTVTGDLTVTNLLTVTGSFKQSMVTITATGSITAAAHAGRTLLLGEVGGDALVTITLPAATGTGNRYVFMVSVVNTSNYVIKVADASDTIDS